MKASIAAKRRTENTITPPPPVLTRPADTGPRGLAAGESTLFSDKYATGNIRLVQQLMRGNLAASYGSCNFAQNALHTEVCMRFWASFYKPNARQSCLPLVIEQIYSRKDGANAAAKNVLETNDVFVTNRI
jgi:hypothetical protein